MPEYLAPGVYIEEVDTGAKPIEGVSTSTAGMVGITERGPVNVPVLVTSVGEFSRWYGGLLTEADYGDHRFLPHAIEGFFTNGGKRVFVSRVLDTAATKAASPLFDRGDAASVASTLVRPAGEGTGSAATPPGLLILPVTGLVAGNWVRVGDGSTAEYRVAAGAPLAHDVMVPVHLPLARSHAAGGTARDFARAAAGAYTLGTDIGPGAVAIDVRGTHANIAALVADVCLEIGGTNVGEYRFVREATSVTVVSGTQSTVHVQLDAPLALPYAAGAALVRITVPGAGPAATIDTAVAGSGLFYVDARGGNFVNRARLVLLELTGATREVRRIGQLNQFDVRPGAYAGYGAGTLVEAVAFAAARTAAAGATATTIPLQAGEAEGLVSGQRVVVDPAGTPQTVVIQGIDGPDTLTVTPALAPVPAAGTTVVPLPKTTTAGAIAGGRVLALDDRMGIAEGTVVRVGTGATGEVVTVTSLPALSFVAPDPGNVVVSPGISVARPAGTTVELVGAPAPVAGRQASALALPATAGSTELYVTDGNGYPAGQAIRVTTTGNGVSYHELTQAAGAAVIPEVLTLQTALARAHAVGSAVVGREPLFDVEALDAGIWGNRLRVSVEDERPSLVSATTLDAFPSATAVRLASAAGVQPGTVLELYDTTTGAVVGEPVKVTNVNRQANFELTLAGGGLTAAQQILGLGVRSREFRLTVRLLRQPDRNNPTRNTDVIDSETFRYLSMDPRHSNYIERVIGEIDGPERRWDRRAEGASLYVRVRDRATTQTQEESDRLGPETLVDLLPDGRRVPARLPLEQTLGGDSIGTVNDALYVGADNVDPDERSGLQSLRNIEEVSIVAVPGRAGAQIQQAVIDHCELLRYRFGVLDARPEPTDTLTDVQDQRQQFDTKYAALYYPWLAIPSPFPDNRPGVQDYPIPPSGHIVGVYARTDITRGVHKAPANEVVRGIVGLRRRINKEQQDILNPYPVNINVIRDFRDNNRGIRVYGGRVITSDSDWKYVNVRRLLIYIEASLDRGLQWVVFEPNAEPLWARVRRVISNFLTVVWRNGALEGTKVEEAFFVKCDRTTMTQIEIDNGQLIVLVGVAPVKPAEFVIVRIGLWTARSDS